MIYVNQNIIKRLLEEAKSAYPFECCGILVGSNNSKKEVIEIYPVENKNKERAQDRYEIDSKRFDAVEREVTRKRLKIIGIYHSHPDHPPLPSAFDKECAQVWSEYSYMIISEKKKEETELRSWYLDQKKQTIEEEEVKIRKHKLILGLSLIFFGFVIYFCMPLIFFSPLSDGAKVRSASTLYFFSWGLTGAGIYFTGREYYDKIRSISKGFLRKIINKDE